MRTCLPLAALLISLSAIAVTAPDGAPMEEDFHQCESLECSTYPTGKFHLTDKVLSAETVYGETFFAEEGASNFHKTIFPPTRIRYVFNPSTGTLYQSGRDYIVTKEGIKLTPGSTIKRAPAELKSTIPDEEARLYKVRVTTEFQRYQYAITYDKQGKFSPIHFGDLGNIPRVAGTVPLKVTFFGDSITQGANATSTYAAPNQPGYVDLVMAYLNAQSPHMWQYRNNSVGGWNTRNAVAAVRYRVMDKKSDLVVLAFGMNDSGGIAAEEYRDNLQKVISDIRTKQPRVPILLVSSSAANPKSVPYSGKLLPLYLKVLRQLTKANKFVAVADVTTVWQMMLKNKRYYDLTGNGLNHPNDFGHRVIAESVLSTILGNKY